MNYTNLEILKELKHIKKCHEDFGKSGRDCIDNTADCIYTNENSGILNFLAEKKYILMQDTSVGRITPYMTSYGKDFLKKHNKFNCFIKDHQWPIGIILSITMFFITSFLFWHFTTNILVNN